MSRSTASTPIIATPAEFLGREVGEGPARVHELRAYFAALAQASDRVRLREYGETAGGRDLFVVIISSPANLVRLAEIHVAQRDLESLAPDDPATESRIAELPAVVWLGCGIHGDEISGPDAALRIAHWLASGTGDAVDALLGSLVIYLDPLVNPDGRERYLAHVAAFSRRQSAVDPQDLLHNAPWPDGRGNHYLFDLNRDAIFTVQRESRARVAAITAALPQLFIDAHEMSADDTFLFAVPAEPLNPHLPSPVHDSWADFAADHAAEFDRDGTSYYTRSWNEVFYPGFFDIWPAYHGAVPILYEQAATSGQSIRLPNGALRTYAQAVDNQFRSARANLGTAAKKRAELLRRWHRARATARAAAPRDWLISPQDPYKGREILRLLLAQGVCVERLEQAVEVTGLHSPWDDKPQRARLPAGTMLVRGAQSLGALIGNIFDFHVPCTEDFLARERRGIDLGAKTLLFDVTAWSLAHAYGAQVSWVKKAPAGRWQRIESADRVTSSPVGTAQYGYVFRDPSLLATGRLLSRGIRVRVSREAFSLDGEHYAPGTMLVRLDDQQANAAEVADVLQKEGLLEIRAAGSARIAEGPDLGGQEFVLLDALRIAMLAGPGLNAQGVGALWHLFDETMGVPVTLLENSRLESVDLAVYSVLLLSEPVDHAGFAATLTGERAAQLRAWVRSGGTLIALGKASLALAEAGLSACHRRGAALEKYPPLMLGRAASDADFLAGKGASGDPVPTDATQARAVLVAAATAFSGKGHGAFVFPDRVLTLSESLAEATNVASIESIGARLRRYLPAGAYLRADLKPLHWLRYGVAVSGDHPDKLAVLCREPDALIADSPEVEVVARYAQPRELALSGLVWPEAVGYLAGTCYLARERQGRGQIISFAGDPVFRGYSLGTQRLLLNAVIFGPALRLD